MFFYFMFMFDGFFLAFSLSGFLLRTCAAPNAKGSLFLFFFFSFSFDGRHVGALRVHHVPVHQLLLATPPNNSDTHLRTNIYIDG